VFVAFPCCLVVGLAEMSNPITDDADYFSARHVAFHRPDAPSPLNTRFEGPATPSDFTSPSSPIARRQVTHSVSADATPKAKWQNLVHRLSTYQGHQDTGEASEDSPHRSLWDMPSHTFNSPTQLDDTLPTPEECYSEEQAIGDGEAIVDEGQSNFFQDPFLEVEEAPVQQPAPVHARLRVPETPQTQSPSGSFHSAGTRRKKFTSFLGRRPSTESDRQDIQMIPTAGRSQDDLHSSPSMAGNLNSNFYYMVS
jgi:hypothetical protein